jgi:glutamyl-Q tRNA(Asp) synthetase
LLPSTHVHGLLQRLLGYETPRYAHHKLMTDADGRRFAKRDKSLTLRALRESGLTPAHVFSLIEVQDAVARPPA